MLRFIDDVLNRFTMYRVMLYYLLFLLAVAAILGAFGTLPYNPLAIIFSAIFISLMCWITNTILARIFKAQASTESYLITALILALIITPPATFFDTQYLEIAVWAAVLAMASKYVVSKGKRHIFNPAAFGVAVTALTLGLSASWWVGTGVMLPAVIIGGLLVVRKIRRFDLAVSFLLVACAGLFISHSSISAGSLFSRIALDTPIFYFALVMLTEPLTTPPTRILRIVYGACVGILYLPSIHIGSIYSTPELALLVGNILSYIVSPKQRLVLKLREKTAVAPDIYHFRFEPDQKISFKPGQYLEWALAHEKPDTRGNRRYFTIASSPQEDHLAIGVKFYPESSTFKQKLASLEKGDTVTAASLAGDFTLPKDPSKKLAFIAGGIGITPFRSMVQHLIDANEKCDAVLLYSNRTARDIAYRDIFDEALRRIGLKTVYTLTDPISSDSEDSGWNGRTGYIDADMIRAEIPDYLERYFYLSGPHAMVEAFGKTLRSMGVPRLRIKKDFFPGFA